MGGGGFLGQKEAFQVLKKGGGKNSDFKKKKKGRLGGRIE